MMQRTLATFMLALGLATLAGCSSPTVITLNDGREIQSVDTPKFDSDTGFYETKIATGRYYMARQLPACGMHLARIETGADTVMALAAEAF